MKPIKFIFLGILLICGLDSSSQTQYSSPTIDSNLGSRLSDAIRIDFRKFFQLADKELFLIDGDLSTVDLKIHFFEDEDNPSESSDYILVKNGKKIVESNLTKKPNGLIDFMLTTLVQKQPYHFGVHGTNYITNETEGIQEPFPETPVKLSIESSNINNSTSIEIKGAGKFSPKNLFKPARFMSLNEKIVCAHRGYWEDKHAPENTYAAFEAAYQQGFKMFEIDLWRTFEGYEEGELKKDTVVVFHDVGLSKRTELKGPLKFYDRKKGKYIGASYNSVKNQPIKNRFGFLVDTERTKLRTLRQTLDHLKQFEIENPHLVNEEVYYNLDRSANDMETFKMVYEIFKEKDMLHKAIFKGKWFPIPETTPVKVDKQPTVENFRVAFGEMYPEATATEIDNHIRLMYFTPVFLDNPLGKNGTPSDRGETNDNAHATLIKEQIDSYVDNGFADGFELDFKAFPYDSGIPKYSMPQAENNNIILLKEWPCLGNIDLVAYVAMLKYPIGIFSSVPEVAAITKFKKDSREQEVYSAVNLTSGFIKEKYSEDFNPKISEQGKYDYRGEFNFFMLLVNYVIIDRPDALQEFINGNE